MNFKRLITVHCSLITILLLLSCAPHPTQHATYYPEVKRSGRPSLFIYRFDPPAFLEYSADFQLLNEIPFHLPPDCGLYNTFPAPTGPFLLIELICPGGHTVLFLDTSSALSAGSASVTQPITDSDAHFLAWAGDGEAAYLKISSLVSPQVVRVHTNGTRDTLPVNEFTYDLAAKPDSRDFTFTFSRGMGYGSELWLMQHATRDTQQLYADPYNYISFTRFSPDGKHIAFIKTPDTQTPFTVGELWVIPLTTDSPALAPGASVANGAQGGKFLAYADAGHGYAANWSPDGTRLAFVVRENPDDDRANHASDALISSIYVVEVESGKLIQITSFTQARAETPFWSPDGNTLVFNAVLDGRMTIARAELASGEIRFLETEPACCPAWMRK